MTTKIYKLTDHNLQTYGGYQWAPGEWKETSGKGWLCSPGWLHCYSHPLLAVLLNPIHADIPNPRLFEGEADGDRIDDHGLKQGFSRMRIIREIPLPVVTTEQRVKFALLCAMEVYSDPAFVAWANAWLDGSDRSARTADAAARTADAAAWAVADAARAARAAVRAAHAAHAAADADAYAWTVARAAADAAAHAAYATYAAARAEKPLDLIVLALKAIEED